MMSPPQINYLYGYSNRSGRRWGKIQNTKANKGTERVATLCGMAGMSSPLWHIDELLRVQCAESGHDCLLRTRSLLIRQRLPPASNIFNECVIMLTPKKNFINRLPLPYNWKILSWWKLMGSIGCKLTNRQEKMGGKHGMVCGKKNCFYKILILCNTIQI